MHQFMAEKQVARVSSGGQYHDVGCSLLVHDDQLINGRLLVLDVDSIAQYPMGQKFRVTLEPIDEPE